MSTVISVLLPTRGRKEMLKRSLESLIDTASDPSRIQVLLGIDEDDTGVLDYVRDNVAPYMQSKGVDCKAQIFQPMGYKNLHRYVNQLAASATGEWIFFWNDDGVMLSQDWDNVIESYNGQFKLLAPKDNHNGHPYAIFPILPTDWYRLMDHLSLNAQNDAWLSHLAYMLDIFERIDVEFLHDRADLTGNNNDDTFQNREYQEGNPDNPEDFGHPDMQQARVRSAFKLAWFLDKIGQHSDWFDRVQRGEVNPFEKMVFPQNVAGAGQLAAVEQKQQPQPAKPSKNRVPDEQKLIL